MAAVSVAFDGTRIDAADAVGNWDNLDTNQSAGLNNDLKYQGTGSISQKVGTKVDGIEYEAASAVNFSTTQRVILFKDLVTTIGILGNLGIAAQNNVQGMNNRIGSAQGDHWKYYIHSKDTYPPSRSWLIIPINPDIAAWRDQVVGTPVITAIDYYAIEAMMSTTARDDNVACDALDYLTVGTGLSLTGGDGADPAGDFDSYLDTDEGIDTNRWGIMSSRGVVKYCTAVLCIGTDVATVFQSITQVVIFEPGLTGPGSTGLAISIGNATNDIDLTNCTLTGAGRPGLKKFLDNISSVDAANDELDITAHGFQTGDPVLYDSVATVIGGLTDATVYYVKKITDDAIALTDTRWAALEGDTRLVLASAAAFSLGGEITGDGVGGNNGVGRVVAINSNDVTVLTISGAWVASNGVDNSDPFSQAATTISSIESANGGIGVSAAATRENHSLTVQPDTRPDCSVLIAITLASSTGFVVGGPITGDGDNGNTGVGVVRRINGNVVLVETLGGAWVATNGVDNADPFVADQTTISSIVSSGAFDTAGGTFDNFRRFSLFTGVNLASILLSPGKILLNGGTLDGCSVSLQTTEEGEALIEADTLANIKNNIFVSSLSAGNDGHVVELLATGTFAFDGNTLSGYWTPAMNGWNFHTITGVDAATEVITTDAAHGFADGDAAYYNNGGGSDTVGLTNLAKYYVNVITTTTLSLHLTRASAIADVARVNLSDGALGQTHSLFSSKAAIYNNSGGSVTVNVGGGGTSPAYRNGSGATTTIVNSVALKVTVTNQAGNPLLGVNVRYEESDGTLIAQGATNASGIFTFNEDVVNLPHTNARIDVRRKDFEDKFQTLTIPTTGFDLPISLDPDTDVDLP